MTLSRQGRLEQLFAELSERPAEVRLQRLAALETDDPELARRLRALLDAHDGPCVLDAPPQPPAPGVGAEESPHDLVGQMVGRYHVLEVLGSGGMGAVCLAEQREPVRRPVALKLIRNGLQSRETVQRFEREAQALALLNNPHVITLLDVGTTPEGTPFLVMEYVQGLPLTDYCREHQLDVRLRVQLFLQLCDGLAHANARGVLHRDIKPSNVLVTGDPPHGAVKIIDFGISKIVDPRAPRGRAVTATGALLGTPEYMSPEQAEGAGRDIDARADVYSAGAVLHEMLMGRPPRRPVGADAADPANRAERRGHRDPRLPRPLQRILQRAVDPDRARRYLSIPELAADCRRFLTGEPVQAAGSRLPRAWPRVGARRAAFLRAGLVVLLALAALAGGRGQAPWAWVWRERSPRAHRSPQTLRVPQDFPRVQAALEAALPGDVVLVAAGTYRENVTLPDSVTLESVAGADATTLDGAFAGPVIDCTDVSPATIVRGFRITHGAAHFGGGIRCVRNASPVLEDNIITENSAVHGAGVAARDGSFPTIRLNRIFANHAESAGGAIHGIDGLGNGVLQIASNEIWGNTAGPGRGMGGAIWVGGIDASLRHNRIYQNSATSSGGAIWAGFAGDKLIAGNLLRANSALERGGAMWVDQGSATIEGNTLAWNTAPADPGIAIGTLGKVTVRDNVGEVDSARLP